MTDRALVNAESRRDDLAARINKLNQDIEALRKELSSVEAFIAEWHQFAGLQPASASSLDPDLGEGSTQNPVRISKAFLTRAPQQTRKNPERGVVRSHARAIIYEKQRPIPRNTLFKELAGRGVHIFGKDPEMVLSTMMWRMKDEFVRLPGYGYWMKSLPWKPAKYEPGVEPLQDIEDLEIELNALENGDADGEG